LQVVIQVIDRLEQACAPVPVPLIIQGNLGQRLGFSFLGGVADRGARFEISTDVRRQEPCGHGRDRDGDPAAFEVWERHGCLSRRAFLHSSDFRRAQREVTAEQRHAFGEVEMRIDDGQSVQD
jgi:hypothetical protein